MATRRAQVLYTGTHDELEWPSRQAGRVQVVMIISWAGFLGTQGLLWWVFGWKMKDVRASPC